ncbi:MAG: hypothetical protein AB1735_08365 [Pseudomonadota bacterium]
MARAVLRELAQTVVGLGWRAQRGLPKMVHDTWRWLRSTRRGTLTLLYQHPLVFMRETFMF